MDRGPVNWVGVCREVTRGLLGNIATSSRPSMDDLVKGHVNRISMKQASLSIGTLLIFKYFDNTTYPLHFVCYFWGWKYLQSIESLLSCESVGEDRSCHSSPVVTTFKFYR